MNCEEVLFSCNVGAGQNAARAGCTCKSAQQTAITQYVRRGRCPHRPGKMQLQNCTHFRRKRKTSCRGGRPCPPVLAMTNLPQRFVKTIVRRAGRARHRPLQMLYGFASVHPCSRVHTARADRCVRPYGCVLFRMGAPRFAALCRRADRGVCPYAKNPHD